MNGTNSRGRLELWGDDGKLGTVCGDRFYWNEAEVACRSMGFNGGRMLPSEMYGQVRIIFYILVSL